MAALGWSLDPADSDFLVFSRKSATMADVSRPQLILNLISMTSS